MALPRLVLAVIGDEIGPSLGEMISFCAENDVRRLDMRTLGGRNLLGMDLSEIRDIRRVLDDAGIAIPTYVSPLLKWPAPGQGPANGKVDFAFDPASCPVPDPVAHAFDIAAIFGARRMRIFSHLRYAGYAPQDLMPAIEQLLVLARQHDVILEMENEPVCSVGSIAELAAFFAWLPQPLLSYLRPLVDIGNSWSMGLPPGDADIALLSASVDQIHLKDRDTTARRTVPLGDGDVPWSAELRRLLAGVTRPEVIASIETHCPQDGRHATARSVAALRRIADEIGVEVI